MQDVSSFTPSLVNQLSSNLRRIQSLGINKIAIGLLEPIGCLPMVTETETPSYEKCNDTLNLFAMNHNQLLLQAVEELNKEMGRSVFVTLDLYTSFLSIIASMQKNPNGIYIALFDFVKQNLALIFFIREKENIDVTKRK